MNSGLSILFVDQNVSTLQNQEDKQKHILMKTVHDTKFKISRRWRFRVLIYRVMSSCDLVSGHKRSRETDRLQLRNRFTLKTDTQNLILNQ
jgi:hypothetical protein